ncbi:MAG: PSD1 domain-containing protein [Planctomycetales bacterium]|nr:PSD1 domain-containing protein [Planctomycetales bacterium]
MRLDYVFISFVIAILLGDLCFCEPISYSRQIQPLFAEHCIECHGPDADKREADLRLDDEPSAKGSAIVAGDTDSSELLVRLTSDDDDTRMPPEGDRLSSNEIALIREWIEQGATYEDHWAYRPIEDPQPPAGHDMETDIDRFILSKLEQQGLTFAPPASKTQLIRRATFDLTGLPPTWDETTAFVNDSSPNAFAKVVDRLLDSPAYGERWGRHWLDLARYADTHGGAAIGFKRFAFSYTYRDYVIDAFNKDLPYDRFLLEQLAADQLDLPANAKQLAGLGFLTVGMQFRNRHDTIDDQIDVISRGLMGLTVSCARCHDHKFDEISTQDYYSLYASLANSDRPEELPIIGVPEPSDQLADYEKQLGRLKIAYTDMARDQSEVLRSRLRMQVGMYLREIAKGTKEQDTSTAFLSYRTEDIRPHVLNRWLDYLKKMPADDSVFGPWVQLSALDNEGFVDRCSELVQRLQKENGDIPKDLHRVSHVPPRWNPRVLTALEAKKPKSLFDVADVYGKLFAEVQKAWLQALADAANEAIPGTQPIPDEAPEHTTINSVVNAQLRRHLHGPDSPTNVDDTIASRTLNRPINDNLSGRREAMHDLNLSAPGSPDRAMSLTETSATASFHVLRRGNPIDRGEPVVPRFLTKLGGTDSHPFDNQNRRLALASAVVAADNPLTRRVFVNWVWQHHFGRGFVRTPDDFGVRGEAPTHPKLLDYIASRLLEDNWSIKQLHRRMMLTRAYQQGSVERLESRIADPDNQLLWRMPRRRLELEAMRDAMLAVSGELEQCDGGRPFDLMANPTVPRRSVYAFVNRDIVSPIFSNFDVANPNACTVKRPETTVPQQTLFALNSDFIQDRAAALASSLNLPLANEPVSETEAHEFIRAMYRRALSRNPTDAELQEASRFVTSTIHTSDTQPTRWQRLAHVLLAANEFVFID